MSTESLLHQFATRIVSLSNAMGLDDVDEQLLWEYLATIPSPDRPRRIPDVLELLHEQAETSPWLITRVDYQAKMDERFIKPSGLIRNILPKRLIKSGGYDVHAVVTDKDEYLEGVIKTIQEECFELWYPHVTAILREDGVNWNPPTASDIDVCIEFGAEFLVQNHNR